jgi:hypothetical protein
MPYESMELVSISTVPQSHAFIATARDQEQALWCQCLGSVFNLLEILYRSLELRF